MLPNVEISEDEFRKITPKRIIDQVRELRKISADSMRRIDDEGAVVRTLKGDVISHPAIKIHADAVKLEESLLSKWARRAV